MGMKRAKNIIKQTEDTDINIFRMDMKLEDKNKMPMSITKKGSMIKTPQEDMKHMGIRTII